MHKIGIFNRLIKRKTRDKSIVWGIRAPKSVKTRWLMLAALMGVPANRLILFVLQDWVQQNSELLLDRQARYALADHIRKLYIDNQLN